MLHPKAHNTNFLFRIFERDLLYVKCFNFLDITRLEKDFSLFFNLVELTNVLSILVAGCATMQIRTLILY